MDHSLERRSDWYSSLAIVLNRPQSRHLRRAGGSAQGVRNIWADKTALCDSTYASAKSRTVSLRGVWPKVSVLSISGRHTLRAWEKSRGLLIFTFQGLHLAHIHTRAGETYIWSRMILAWLPLIVNVWMSSWGFQKQIIVGNVIWR